MLERGVNLKIDMPAPVGLPSVILAEQLCHVLDKTDGDDEGGDDSAHDKHDHQNVNDNFQNERHPKSVLRLRS